MARDWRNQYYFRSWSQFQQIFWLLSSDKVTLTSCNSAEPSQGVFSLNGQKQQQTCFLFLRILNKKWGRDALWKLEKRNFDVHHFIRHFIFLCWIITVKCLRVVVLSVSMFCVCTKRGRALPPPIVTHHPAWHAEIQIIWPGTVGLTLAWPSVAALCWLGASVTSDGDRVTGPRCQPHSALPVLVTTGGKCQPDSGAGSQGTSENDQLEYLPLEATVWQHYNIVTVSQSAQTLDGPPKLLTW